MQAIEFVCLSACLFPPHVTICFLVGAALTRETHDVFQEEEEKGPSQKENERARGEGKRKRASGKKPHMARSKVT